MLRDFRSFCPLEAINLAETWNEAYILLASSFRFRLKENYCPSLQHSKLRLKNVISPPSSTTSTSDPSNSRTSALREVGEVAPYGPEIQLSEAYYN